MAWVPSHTELREHPKTKRCARMLGAPRAQMIGHLHMLWWWALDYAKDGDLSRYDAADIADAAEWAGDPGAFVDALAGCGARDQHGFLEREGGRLLLHDWGEYGGRYLEQRRKDADRKRAARATPNSAPPDGTTPPTSRANDGPQTSTGRPPDVEETADVEEIRGEEKTEEQGQTFPSTDVDGEGVENPPPVGNPPPPQRKRGARIGYPPDFEAFWATEYPHRDGKPIGKAAAFMAWQKLTNGERDRAVIGARHLARSDRMPKDPERWLRRDKAGAFPFDDWQQPPEALPANVRPIGGAMTRSQAADDEIAALLAYGRGDEGAPSPFGQLLGGGDA